MTGLSRGELGQVAVNLRKVLAAIDTGEIRCSAGMRNRIEGARLAVEALAAGASNDRLHDTPGVIL